MRIAFFLLSCLFFCENALGQEAQERLTLQDAIARSLENGFDIRITDITAQQAEANNTLGNAGLLPNINGTAGFNTGLSNTNIQFADGRTQTAANASTISYNTGVVASYTIFAAGRAWLVKKQLNANEQLVQVQVRAQMQQTVSQTIQAYARVVWQEQQRIAIDTGIALAKTRMILSKVKFETGSSAKVDYLQARVDYNARRSDSLTRVAGLNTAFADLNYLMGENPYKTYIVDDSVIADLALLPKDKSLLRETNLSVNIARRNVEISKINARIAKTYLFPSLGATAGYSYNKSQSHSGYLLFSEGFGPTGGLNFNVPIFQGGNLRRQTKVAALESFRQEIIYDKQNTDVARQYRSAWKDYKSSIYAYNLEKENISYARENLYIQKARFRVGIATTVETREAENSYVQALIRLYTAAYNAKINETRVRELESSLVQQ